MARYRDIDMRSRLLPVSLEAQIVPRSFVHAVRRKHAFNARHSTQTRATRLLPSPSPAPSKTYLTTQTLHGVIAASTLAGERGFSTASTPR
jgi:hypothetical protein